MKKKDTTDKEILSQPKNSKNKKELLEEIKEISLEYKLHELPSSQHKAGLAGLYLIIDWLDKQDINKELIKKTELTETGLKVTLTKKDVKDLFDEIYKPTLIDIESKSEPLGVEFTTFERREKTTFYYYEIESKSLKKDKDTKKEIQPIREIVKEIPDNKSGKLKNIKFYIYEEKLQEKKEIDDEEIDPIREEEVEDVITYYAYKKDYPLGSFLYAFDKSTDNVWVKIWREMQWLLRGFKQQEPFKSRLENKDFSKDANDFWEVLIKDNPMNDLSKVLFLSAQNNNAENVDFKETTKNKLLLHFWIFVAQPYAYWTQRKDKNKYKTDEHGFIIAIPDIAKLESFIFIFSDLIQNQDKEIKKYPIKRPEQAVVYLPSLAGLLLLKNIHDILRRKINANYSDVVYGIDLFHYDFEWKSGKAKKNRASIFKGYTRIKPNIDLENKSVGIKRLYKNFFFQKQLLQNLFEGRDELYNFYNLFSTREYEYFFNYWEGEFKPDAKMYFDEKEIKGEQDMSEEEKIPKTIEPLVHQIIRTYVSTKLETKFQTTLVWDKEKKVYWSKSRNAPANEDDYKNKSKIAKEAFLAIRSRKDKDDFITYFTSTICSVSQRLGEEGYTVLAESLYNKNESVGWEKIRALSMLALSANG
jgi:CRISPR-associated protein Cmx8